jgi:capsular exopolysaccharide synthesis family protein
VDDPALETHDVPAAHAPGRNPLDVCWQRRSLLLLGAVVGLVVGALLYARKPPVYQTVAQVLVVKKRSDALPVAGGDPRLSFYEDYVSTHLVLIRSPLVVQRAVQKRDLGSLRSFAGHGDPVGAVRAGLAATRDLPKDKDAGAMPNNIINLSFRCGDAEDTATILATVIESYREFLDETYRNVSDNTLELIIKARDLLKQDLADKEKKYREFREKSPLLWKGSDGANIHLTRIKEFQAKQTAMLARIEDVRERLKAIDKARKEGGPRSVLLALATRPLDKAPAPSLERNLEEQLFPLLLKERALLHDYGKDHPEVMRVREQITMTKEFFSRLEGVARKEAGAAAEARPDLLETHLLALKQELALVETSREAMGRLLAEEEKQARALERYEIQDEEFRADITRTTKVLDQTLKRLEEISLVRDFGGYEAKVIAAPGVGEKTSPIAWQMLAGGLMLGLMAGVGLAFLAEVRDKSFRTPEEIRRRLRLPVVGHIPFVSIAKGKGPLDPSLLSFHCPGSPEAEAYRGVRTAVYFSTRGERHKVLQVTSPNMGDGKTTMIANLAVSIAQSGRKVVLVDADLRRPRVHRLFGLPARSGLALVVAGSADLAEAVQDSGVPGLSVLACGPRPSNPAELLTTPRFEEVLEHLREDHDFVLVDTPPLLAVTDPCVVAPRVDGVLLVLRASKNGRPPAERACSLLAGLGANVLGVVVNGVGKQGAMNGYGYEHYHYGSEYGSEYTPGEGDGEAAEAAADHADPSAPAHPDIHTNGEAHRLTAGPSR